MPAGSGVVSYGNCFFAGVYSHPEWFFIIDKPGNGQNIPELAQEKLSKVLNRNTAPTVNRRKASHSGTGHEKEAFHAIVCGFRDQFQKNGPGMGAQVIADGRVQIIYNAGD
jgi:hypothetical protein